VGKIRISWWVGELEAYALVCAKKDPTSTAATTTIHGNDNNNNDTTTTPSPTTPQWDTYRDTYDPFKCCENVPCFKTIIRQLSVLFYHDYKKNGVNWIKKGPVPVDDLATDANQTEGNKLIVKIIIFRIIGTVMFWYSSYLILGAIASVSSSIGFIGTMTHGSVWLPSFAIGFECYLVMMVFVWFYYRQTHGRIMGLIVAAGVVMVIAYKLMGKLDFLKGDNN